MKEMQGYLGSPTCRGIRHLGTLAILAGCLAAPGVCAAQVGDAHPAYIPLQGDKAVSVRDSHTLAPIATMPTDGQSIDSRLTPDGTKLYVINVFNPKVTVIRARCPADRDRWTEEEQRAGQCMPNSRLGSITVTDKFAFYFSIPADGRWMYLMSSAGMISPSHINVVDTRTDKIVRTFEAPKGTIAAAISPDNTLLWTGALDGSVQAIDAATAKPVGPVLKVAVAPATMKLSADGSRLYTVSMPGPSQTGAPVKDRPPARINIIDTKAFKMVAGIAVGTNSMILGFDVSPDSRQVWSANGNNTVSVVAARSGKLLKTITVPFELAEAVDVSADNERALVIGFNGKLDPMNPQPNFPAFAQLYSTRTFQPLGKPVSLGNNSGGIPSLSAD